MSSIAELLPNETPGLAEDLPNPYQSCSRIQVSLAHEENQLVVPNMVPDTTHKYSGAHKS